MYGLISSTSGLRAPTASPARVVAFWCPPASWGGGGVSLWLRFSSPQWTNGIESLIIIIIIKVELIYSISSSSVVEQSDPSHSSLRCAVALDIITHPFQT